MNSHRESQRTSLGAIFSNRKTSFRIWAPYFRKVEVEIWRVNNKKTTYAMDAEERGYHSLLVDDVPAGTDYFFVLDGKKKRADPASKFQPQGVHEVSRVVDPSAFKWSDAKWKGIRKEDLIIYELHVGTYSTQGTFEAIIPHLDYLKNTLGVTAMELMPVGQFPGSRNWGYDGVFFFAPQNTYGGPEGLKRLIDACHAQGLAIFLDVVYNHAGPEGNQLEDFGPYFSKRYTTPWGPAFNYYDHGSDEVRKFIVQNAVYWINEYHFDGFRLDAIHRIFDLSPKHILLELSEAMHAQAKKLGRQIHVIAESDLNDPRILVLQKNNGYEMDSQWADDFHHSVHSYLSGERFEDYSDYGSIEDIAQAIASAFVFDGKYSFFRGKSFGASSGNLPGSSFVFYIQNHDQVGNRPDGTRLSSIIEIEKLKLAVALLLLSQSLPLLFMGEEYAESSPFHYFVSHSNAELIRKLRKEKREQFESFPKKGFSYADPQDEKTFVHSRLNHDLKKLTLNKNILDYYRELIEVRKKLSALRNFDRNSIHLEVLRKEKTIVMKRESTDEELVAVFVLGDRSVKLPDFLFARAVKVSDLANWRKAFDSSLFDLQRQETANLSLVQERQARFPGDSVSVFVRER